MVKPKNDESYEINSISIQTKDVKKKKKDDEIFPNKCYIDNQGRLIDANGKVVAQVYKNAIVAVKAKPSDEDILNMLETGVKMFGSIKVTGTPDFIKRAKKIALENNITLSEKDTSKEDYPDGGGQRQRMR